MKTFNNERIVKDYLRFDYSKATGKLEEIHSVVTVESIVGAGSENFGLHVIVKSADDIKYRQDDHIIFPPTAKNILLATEYYAAVATELLRLEAAIVDLYNNTNYIKQGKATIETGMKALGFLRVLADTE